MKFACDIYNRQMWGWANRLRKLGHTFIFKDNDISYFDFMDENNPDIFIGSVQRSTLKLARCLNEFEDLIKTFYWSNCGYIVCPSFIPSYDKELLLELKPDIVFTSHSNLDEINTDSFWKENSINIISSPEAADIEQEDSPLPYLFDADISYIGPPCDDILSLLTSSEMSKYKIKLFSDVFGDYKWTVPNYLGKIKSEHIKSVHQRSQYCIYLTFPENESRVDQEFYQIIVDGGYPATINELSSGYVGFDENKELFEEVKDSVLANHTYNNRIEILLDEINKL